MGLREDRIMTIILMGKLFVDKDIETNTDISTGFVMGFGSCNENKTLTFAAACSTFTVNRFSLSDMLASLCFFTSLVRHCRRRNSRTTGSRHIDL